MKYKKKTIKSILSMILSFSMILSSVLTTAWTVNAVNAIVGEKSEYGIVGSMTGWGKYDDFPMHEIEEGIFVGSTGTLQSGEYVFEVRKDSDWTDIWSEYSEDYDRTKNNQTNISVHIDGNAELLVKLDTTIYEEKLWAVSYAIITEANTDPDWIYTGKKEFIDSEKNLIYKLNEDNTISIIEYIGDDRNVIIPDTIDGKIVTSISGCRKTINYMNNWYGAFEDCKNLTKITIPNSVTKIASSAFAGCENLVSITIPDNVTEIGSSAFDGCKSLTNIIIPNKVKEIGGYTFRNCSSLTSITIPDGVTEIGGYSAFEGCESLTNIKIPDNVKEIGKYTFRNCSSFTSITIPDGVTEIGYDVFSGCTGLKSVIIPNSVITIGNSAFEDCTGLTSITIPDSVTSIGDYAFRDCKGLTSITIPDSVTSIGSSAFENCTGLTSITIPNSVTEMDSRAFYGCENLQSVLISENIPSWNDNVFYGMWSSFNLFGKKGSYAEKYAQNTEHENFYLIDDNGFAYSENDDGTVWVVGYLGNHENIVIPNKLDGKTVTGIYSMNRSHDKEIEKIKSIVVPKSVTYIGYHAFSSCTGLASIDVDKNNTVYSSDNGVLLNKDKTTIILCPEGKKGTYTIPNSVTSIGSSAFEDCTGLTSITIPDSVTSIGYWAFYGCTGLVSIDVDKNNTVYSSDNGVLLNKDKTTIILCPEGKKGTYTIPNSVTSIGSSAFEDCTGLTSITIPDSVTSIGDGAFDDTTWYNNQTDGLIYLGKVAYKYKGEMPENTSIQLKNDTVSISGNAFRRGCSGLINVEIPDSVEKIGSAAFKGCHNLKSVKIPDSVTFIGRDAFGYMSYFGDDPTKTDGFVIYGVSGSAAEIYANENNMTFVKIYNKILGDTNGDESVDIADALMIARYDAGLAELDETQLSVSDVNTDDSVDIADALMVARFDAGLIQNL